MRRLVLEQLQLDCAHQFGFGPFARVAVADARQRPAELRPRRRVGHPGHGAQHGGRHAVVVGDPLGDAQRDLAGAGQRVGSGVESLRHRVGSGSSGVGRPSGISCASRVIASSSPMRRYPVGWSSGVCAARVPRVRSRASVRRCCPGAGASACHASSGQGGARSALAFFPDSGWNLSADSMSNRAGGTEKYTCQYRRGAFHSCSSGPSYSLRHTASFAIISSRLPRM